MDRNNPRLIKFCITLFMHEYTEEVFLHGFLDKISHLSMKEMSDTA